MELRGFHKTLEKVLIRLLTDPDVTAVEIEKLSGEYRGRIKDYLKDNKVVDFLADGTLWHVNRRPLENSLEEVRMILGEYRKERDKERNKRLREVLVLFMDALVAFYAGWFLRGCDPEYNAASGRPEPMEQSRIILDSISLSELSSSCLKAERTPSLAKSLTVISDSSASTRLMCITLRPSIRTETVQSSLNASPLWFSPSGKLYVTDIFIAQT